MSEEYKIILEKEVESDIVKDIAGEISSSGIFQIVDSNSDYISCIYINEINNQDLLDWGGNFIIAKEKEKWFLTINTGNLVEIKNEIISCFKRLDISVKIEDLE